MTLIRRLILLKLIFLYIVINILAAWYIDSSGPQFTDIAPATPVQVAKIAGAMSRLKNTDGLSPKDIAVLFNESQIIQSAVYFFDRQTGIDLIALPAVYVDTGTEAALAASLAHELAHRKWFLATGNYDTRQHWKVDLAALEFIDAELFLEGGRDTVRWLKSRMSLIPTWLRIAVPGFDLSAGFIISDLEQRRKKVKKSLIK